MKKIYLLTVCFLFVYFSNAQNRLDSLLIERQNNFQNLIWRIDPNLLKDKEITFSINAIGTIDSLIAEENHRIDSVLKVSDKMSPLIGNTIQNLKVKKDRAQTYFYISLVFMSFLIGLSIYLTERNNKLNKSIIDLKADISEVNKNYVRTSEDKIKLHRELNLKNKTLEKKIQDILIENERLVKENNILFSEEHHIENKFLKEAISLLESQKIELLNEIELLKKNKSTAAGEEIDNIKNEFTKRVEYLENALKTKDIMESVVAKRIKDLEEKISDNDNFIQQLSLELEEEKTFNDKLTQKITYLEEEVVEKDSELKTLWNKISKKIVVKQSENEEIPVDSENNMLHTIEKLNRLKDAEIISQNEFDTLKEKLIGKI